MSEQNLTAVNDPIFKKLDVCPKCGKPMGEFRVFEGTTDSKAYKRGHIVQTCTGHRSGCHYTIHHSDVTYVHADAQHLVQRLELYAQGQSIDSLPDEVRYAALRIAPRPIPPSSTGSIKCPGQCTSRQGGEKRAHRNCIEYLCSSCCTAAYHQAAKFPSARDACKAHGQAQVLDSPALVIRPSQHPQQLLPPPTPLVQSLPAPQFTTPRAASSLPAAIASTVNRVSAAKGKIGTASKSTGKGNRNLSQPMAADWLQPYTISVDKRSEDEKRMQERQQMLERQRREVRFVCWYEAEKQPYRITFSISLYPRASLSAIPPLVSNLELTDNSYIETWDLLTQSWTNITLISEFDVDKERATLIRVGQSLRSIVNPSECVGLGEQLDLQPHYRRSTKRVAESLTSPVKKSIRTEQYQSANTYRLPTRGETRPSSPCPDNNPPTSRESSIPASNESPHTATTQSGAVASGSLVCHAQPTKSMTSLSLSPFSDAPTHIPCTAKEKKPRIKAQNDFPLDYPVSFFGEGMREIHNRKGRETKTSEKQLYEEVYGHPYRKSSAVKYKKLWNQASRELQDHFIRLGDQGSWNVFLRCLNDPTYNLPLIPAQSATSSALNANTVTDSPYPKVTPPAVTSDKEDVASVNNSTPSIHSNPIQLLSPLSPPTELPKLSHQFPENSVNLTAQEHDSFDLFLDANHGPRRGYAGGMQCPFCDEFILPPSEKLRDMLARLYSITDSDPLPHNPGHRKATSFTVTIDFCARHGYELELAEKPESLCWPRTINTVDLFRRILQMRPTLINHIKAPHNSFYFKQVQSYYSDTGMSAHSPIKRFMDGKLLRTGTG
ncbi:hypothetical protein PQX77_000963 [Marasmius sp. AFHP31]|nr:hypothetical protein PQX77_001029 [Marasmius sp. AFHP31]KAK1235805.1 hypothetical protein PQX77_000963 [Marasmius sp. AFHP31]